MLKFIRILFLSQLILSLFIFNCTFAATIMLPRTGQTTCTNENGTVIACTGTGQDGEKMKGAAWPASRFTDNANGTVTDNLTGLIWLKNASCFGAQPWNYALTSANTLASGTCGLTDSSIAGQWRLPNIKELESLLDRSNYSPALQTGYPFTPQSASYWSSTSLSGGGSSWVVDIGGGSVSFNGMGGSGYVWPVRGGQ